jgi:ABC-type uncharacterized transport system auxiliary subunit
VKYLTLAGLMLALSGCGSLFHSNAPPVSTYQLSVKEGGPVGAAVPVDLAVLLPRVRNGLDTDHIAALYSDRRLDYFAGVRWSGPLDEMLQDLTLEAFHAYANLRNVRTDGSAFDSGYWLEIDVVDFQAEFTGTESKGDSAPPTIHVHLLGRLGSAGDRHVLGQFDADARQPAADNRLTAIVGAYNRAADTALAKIVADTVDTLNNNLVRR